MRLVKQRYENDCGCATVAMLAGVTYGEARKALYGSQLPRSTSSAELRRALIKLGKRPGSRLIPLRSRHYRDIDGNAILKVNVKRNGVWHWVALSKNKVLDPRNPSYQRLRAVSYMIVR